ncbi:MAG: type IIA DNA topoisomerase subunit B [Acidimicrobiales bacterium]
MAGERRRAKGGYDASDIVTLEGLEAVRKRPGMYIGGTGSAGFSHLLWELLDNAVDEAAAGHATQITVTFERDGSIEVSDNGRGIPIDRHEKKKVSALEVVFTELHAGGKFGTGAYTASGGLHGVGASVVNALSRKLVAEVDRDGATWRLSFLDRVAGRFDGERFVPGHTLEQVRKIPAARTGTRVRYWPDFDVFERSSTIDYAEVRARALTMCFLVPRLRITLVDKRQGGAVTDELVATGGLVDFVEHLSVGEPVTEVISLAGSEAYEETVPVDGRLQTVVRECTVEAALRWVKGYDTQVVSFVNTIPTPDGGTHLAGFERALNRAVNEALIGEAKKLKRLKEDGRAVRDDVAEGLVAVLKVTVPEPQFRGQTKRELGTPAVQSVTYNVVKAGLLDWVGRSGKKVHVNALRDKIVNAIITRVTQRQQRETLRRASALGSAGMPDKLADCRSSDVGRSELLIVEGDSAAGPAKAGRNSEIQAVLPIRGKIINAGKATHKQVLDNAEAAAIFTAVGAGAGPEFDLASARYGRLVILADADVDGSHIRCLLLTLFYQYMRPMLEAGRVFVAMPPLYTITVGGRQRGKRYAYDDAERARVCGELDAAGVSYTIGRNKGLGEMDVDELATTTLDPATRVLRRVTVANAEEAAAAASAFDVLMGREVGPRKDFIVESSTWFDREALDI